MAKDKSQSKRTKKFMKNKLSAELARRNKFKGGKKSNKQNTNHNSKSNNNAQNSHEDALLKQEIGKLIAGFEKGQKNEKDDSYLQEEESDLEDIDEDVVEFSDNDLDEEDEPKEEEEEDENGENDNEEDQEDEEIQNDPQIQQLSSEVQKHKQELESLKKQDPEFAQYLKDHDKELLSFMDESDDEEPEDDDNDLEGHGEMDNEEEDGKEPGEPANEGGSRAVRSVHVDNWINDATQTNSLKSLKRLVVAFRSASHMNDEDYNSSQYHYKIVSSDAFDKLLHFCIGSFGELFENILNKDGASQTSKKKKKQNKKANAWDTSKWDNNPHWSKLEPLVKSFLGSLIHIMSQITDDKTILFIIQKSEKLAQYFGAFPKLARMFLKAIVDFWGSGAENVKIACFFDLRQLITSIPQFRESVLKSVYLSYVRNSKFYNPKTMKGIMLMCNCLVELYAMDMAVGYKLAFIYIRQLAIHLRNAIQLNTKDALKNVYNWQFVNSLRVWCSLIAGFPEQPEVSTLVYPITQLLMAIITHNPSSKYFPLRFHCIRMLHQIAGPSKVFVNTAPYILETLESPEFKKKAKLTSGKPLGFSSLLKVSKTVLPTNLFQDAVVKNAFELLLHMFSSYANNAAFPELAFPTVVFLKKFIKTNKVPAFTKKMGQLLDQIQRNAQYVQAQRDKAEFKPADIENVKQFLSDNDKAPLQQFYRNWKTTEDRLKQLKQQGEDDDDEEDGEGFSDEEDQPPKKKSKTEDKQTKNKTNNNKQQENGKTKPNVDKKVLKQVKRKEKKAERKKQKGQNNKDDVVEDFVMSDDE